MPFRSITIPPLTRVVGIDFSGAALSGKTAWLAELEVCESAPRLSLVSLNSLGRLAGSDERHHVCQYVVDRILDSRQTVWGIDFPFGLPIELDLGDWSGQLHSVANHDGDARDYGRQLVEISQRTGSKMHIRRITDTETQTPFDCYHYRIIYQTFHGMRDVLRPLVDDAATAILPFQYGRSKHAQRLVVEACPSSTLKRMGLPHRLYKQTGNKPPDDRHRKTRREILRRLGKEVQFSSHRRGVMMNDPGGDALDALIAAVGTWHAIQTDDHREIANHNRYPREGRVYC